MRHLINFKSYLTRLRGLTITLIILISYAIGDAWGTDPVVDNVIFKEQWGGDMAVSSYTFTGTTTWSGSTTGLSYASDNASSLLSTATAGGITTDNFFFVKASVSTLTMGGIAIPSNVDSVLISFDSNKTIIECTYSFTGGSDYATGATSVNGTQSFGVNCHNKSTLYLKFKKTGTSSNARMDNVVVTVKKVAATNTPTLTVAGNATSLAIGDAKVSGSGKSNNTLTFSGTNLTANATLGISGTNAAMFDVTPKSVAPSTGTITNQTITITYSPTTAGDHTATLTISSDGATSKTITLTGTGKYEVIWKNNGGIDTTTLVANGSRPSFPNTPTSCDTGEGASTTFYGWANNSSTWSGKINSLEGQTVYTSAASMPIVSGNGTTYHAVFCKGGNGSITITNKLFTDTLGSSYGTYYITAGGYRFEMNACKQSSKCQMRDNATLSYIAIPSLPGAIIGISTSACTDASGSNYTGTLHFKHTKTRGNADDNDIAKVSYSSVSSFNWDLSSNTSYTSGYLLTSAGLRMSDLTISYSLPGTNFMTNCCTDLDPINGSFLWT